MLDKICTRLDAIISKLYSLKDNPQKKKILSKTEIRFLCDNSKSIFANEPSLLELNGKYTVCGDIHGQFYDLLDLLEHSGPIENTKYLFLGDYVDRGNYSIHTICMLLALKIKYKDTFFLIRGNHESSPLNRIYGLKEECCELYSEHLWPLLNAVFDMLPLAAILNQTVFCVHGGISPHLTDLEEIKKIQRPCSIPEEGLICDLLWSDPNKNCHDWSPSERKCGYLFGEKQLKEILDNLSLDMVIRSHEYVDDGYQYPFYPNKSLLTIFSSPDYNDEPSKAAYLTIDENNNVEVKQFEKSTRPSSPS